MKRLFRMTSPRWKRFRYNNISFHPLCSLACYIMLKKWPGWTDRRSSPRWTWMINQLLRCTTWNLFSVKIFFFCLSLLLRHIFSHDELANERSTIYIHIGASAAIASDLDYLRQSLADAAHPGSAILLDAEEKSLLKRWGLLRDEGKERFDNREINRNFQLMLCFLSFRFWQYKGSRTTGLIREISGLMTVLAYLPISRLINRSEMANILTYSATVLARRTVVGKGNENLLPSLDGETGEKIGPFLTPFSTPFSIPFSINYSRSYKNQNSVLPE